MYIVQSHILESNIIGQIIMGSVGSTTSDRSNCDADDYDCLCDLNCEIRFINVVDVKECILDTFDDANNDNENLIIKFV